MKARLVAAAAAIAVLSAIGMMARPGVETRHPLVLYAAQATSTRADIATTIVAHIEEMSVQDAIDAVKGMSVGEAVQIFNGMSTDKAVKMMGGMDVVTASAIWGDMEPRKEGEVMEDVPIDAATSIVEIVPEQSLIARLPEISAQKLWEMPPELLLGKLPSVDAMHLNAWVRPQVAPDLPGPVAADPLNDRSVYIVPEGRESEWALVGGSPAPTRKDLGQVHPPAC